MCSSVNELTSLRTGLRNSPLNAISADESCINNNKRRKIVREAYKVQNVNHHISKVGLIRMYKNLLSKKKISADGPAHRRLKRLMDEENWWDKI